MSKKRNNRRKQKQLLTRLEQDIALLHKTKFEEESVEEMRQSLIRQFITHDQLSDRQIHAIHKLAAPLRSRSKAIKTNRRRQKHYVYAISDGAFLKIGLAVDPIKRMSDLQVASPSVLKLEAKIECPRYSDAAKLEKQLHRACRKHRIRGEWFQMDALIVFDNYG